MDRISSVPDKEFDRPQTTDELYAVVDLACDIMWAVLQHVKENDGAHSIVFKVFEELVDAHCWIVAGKWIGVPAWQKAEQAA